MLNRQKIEIEIKTKNLLVVSIAALSSLAELQWGFRKLWKFLIRMNCYTKWPVTLPFFSIEYLFCLYPQQKILAIETKLISNDQNEKLMRFRRHLLSLVWTIPPYPKKILFNYLSHLKFCVATLKLNSDQQRLRIHLWSCWNWLGFTISLHFTFLLIWSYLNRHIDIESLFKNHIQPTHYMRRHYKILQIKSIFIRWFYFLLLHSPLTKSVNVNT